MTQELDYSKMEPVRDEIDALEGPAVIEFGTPWCGHCRAAQELIASALESHPGVRHLKIVDAKGRPLGRSFGVKLWPTLIFLKDGAEVARVIRPTDVNQLHMALYRIDSVTAANQYRSAGSAEPKT